VAWFLLGALAGSAAVEVCWAWTTDAAQAWSARTRAGLGYGRPGVVLAWRCDCPPWPGYDCKYTGDYVSDDPAQPERKLYLNGVRLHGDHWPVGDLEPALYVGDGPAGPIIYRRIRQRPSPLADPGTIAAVLTLLVTTAMIVAAATLYVASRRVAATEPIPK
jgi:hypothetical protein